MYKMHIRLYKLKVGPLVECTRDGVTRDGLQLAT
eukprot:SAG22_NODE_800_length_7109_cov_47.259058_3_plen_34_part_00